MISNNSGVTNDDRDIITDDNSNVGRAGAGAGAGVAAADAAGVAAAADAAAAGVAAGVAADAADVARFRL